mgnify:CR=1 FL=1|tara:strand:- start:187 stop:315 length:129 start_codon:yes stop_codon:yes gene_type:complete
MPVHHKTVNEAEPNRLEHDAHVRLLRDRESENRLTGFLRVEA